MSREIRLSQLLGNSQSGSRGNQYEKINSKMGLQYQDKSIESLIKWEQVLTVVLLSQSDREKEKEHGDHCEILSEY
jgi:hypothetical protein